MAIIRNPLFVNVSRSIGDITLRNVNGRTIASKRVYVNNSKSDKQLSRRSSFSLMSQLGRDLRPILEIGFPAKNGSYPHTSFIKWNNTLANYFSTHTSPSEYNSVLFDLHTALLDPLFFGQVLSSSGNLHTKGFFKINDEKLPEGALALSCDYEENDRVILGVCAVFYYENVYHGQIRLFERTINLQQDIDSDCPTIFRINETTMPELQSCTSLPPGAMLTGYILTGIVLREEERSTATFMAIS